ncbi:S-adenosyl-L-methionine-dependent methyltransferase [Hypoxylon cercidicola]|nr:S-adenosyl-L-methionine-dependent methyltransferase [Hypoxylon cercidicola]
MANQAMDAVQDPYSSFLSLGQNIFDLTQDMTKYFRANDLAVPTFALDSQDPPNTPEYRRLHANLKTSLEDLLRLIDGPRKWLRAFCCTGYDLGALQVALDFEFFLLIPSPGDITLEGLAKKAGLDLDRTSRVVRQLMTYRIFEELQPRVISHSSTSLVMQQDEELRSVVHYSLDEMLKAAADCNVSLKANPYEAHQNLNPFVTRHGVGIFEFYKKNPDKARRFAKAMAGLRKLDRHLDYLLQDGFNWSAIEGTVVDCGGGNGHISKSLAELYPSLDFVVQDSNADMLAEGRNSLPDSLRGRVSFFQHSFFDPQPIKDAAAFLIRQCTHNWADRDVVTILKSFIPGLENSSPDTPLLINDIIIPEPGTWPRHEERVLRQVDMVMLVNCGSKQRTKAEFEELLKEADPRYEIRSLFDNGPLGLLEVYLKRSSS